MPTNRKLSPAEWNEVQAKINAKFAALETGDKEWLADFIAECLNPETGGTWTHFERAAATIRKSEVKSPAAPNTEIAAMQEAIKKLAEGQASIFALLESKSAPKPETLPEPVTVSSRSARKAAREKIAARV